MYMGIMCAMCWAMICPTWKSVARLPLAVAVVVPRDDDRGVERAEIGDDVLGMEAAVVVLVPPLVPAQPVDVVAVRPVLERTPPRDVYPQIKGIPGRLIFEAHAQARRRGVEVLPGVPLEMDRLAVPAELPDLVIYQPPRRADVQRVS
jgi:hypothetical protein